MDTSILFMHKRLDSLMLKATYSIRCPTIKCMFASRKYFETFKVEVEFYF